jgi:hypothetical protein
MVRDFEEMRNERITKRREYDNRVGQPSNHPAAWVYMTAEMLYGENYELLHQLYSE